MGLVIYFLQKNIFCHDISEIFKLSIAVSILATLVGASNFKRVACPDGVNTAINAAVCPHFTCT